MKNDIKRKILKRFLNALKEQQEIEELYVTKS